MSRVIIVNVYIPPVSSPYAPTDYTTCLTDITHWINCTRLQFGAVAQVVWAGDFNARIGQRIYPEAADTTANARGTLLLDALAAHTLLPSTPSVIDCPTFTHNRRGGAPSTLDYLWIERPLHPTPPVTVYAEHWLDPGCPSDHAVLVSTIPLPAATTPDHPLPPPVVTPRHLATHPRHPATPSRTPTHPITTPVHPHHPPPRPPVRILLSSDEKLAFRQVNWSTLAAQMECALLL